MTLDRNVGFAQSIRARLLNHSHRMKEEFNVTLRQYFYERFLYRLGCSVVRERYILKGAMLLRVWSDRPYRSTMDLDLLRRAAHDPESLAVDLRAVCETAVPADAVVFDPAALALGEIRIGDDPAAVRVRLFATLGSARDRLQIDVGAADAVWPEPRQVDFPVLLDLPAPRILAYRPETVVAEKIEAMVVLGMSNSRIKDLFDVHYLATRFPFEGESLVKAISLTFSRRSTPFPSALPLMLTSAYWEAPERALQLQAFARRARINTDLPSARALLPAIGSFLEAPLAALRTGRPLKAHWLPGGPWRERTGCNSPRS